MPLARIVTDVPEEAMELALQLQARGFQVETLSSHATPSQAADLEVRLDECAVDDVLQYATEMGAGDVACVFVAPGALEEGGRSAVKTINLLASQPDRVTTEVAVVEESHGQIEQFPARVIAAESLDPAIVEAAAQPASFDHHVAPSGGLLELQFSEVGAAQQAEIVLLPLPVEMAPLAAAPLPPVISDQAIHTASDADARVVEISSPHLAADQLTVEPHADANPGVSTANLSTQVMARRRERLATVTTLRSRAESDRAFWRVAIAAAALAVFVVAAGSLWHRVRPMPEYLATPTSQQAIPFRKTPAPAHASAAKEPAGKGQAQASPNAPIIQSSSNNNTGSKAPAPSSSVEHLASAPPPASASLGIRSNEIPPSPKKPSAKRKTSRETELIAEDTVVFYNKKPGAPSAKTASQPGVRQYSDAR